MFCDACGTPTVAGSAFCPSCGHRLGATAGQPAGAASPSSPPYTVPPPPIVGSAFVAGAAAPSTAAVLARVSAAAAFVLAGVHGIAALLPYSGSELRYRAALLVLLASSALLVVGGIAWIRSGRLRLVTVGLAVVGLGALDNGPAGTALQIVGRAAALVLLGGFVASVVIDPALRAVLQWRPALLSATPTRLPALGVALVSFGLMSTDVLYRFGGSFERPVTGFGSLLAASPIIHLALLALLVVGLLSDPATDGRGLALGAAACTAVDLACQMVGLTLFGEFDLGVAARAAVGVGLLLLIALEYRRSPQMVPAAGGAGFAGPGGAAYVPTPGGVMAQLVPAGVPLASPWVRWLASLIDTLVGVLPLAAVVGGLVATRDNAAPLVLGGLVGVVLWFVLTVPFWKKGQSVGKRMTGLRVVSAETGRAVGGGDMFVREIVYRQLLIGLLANLTCGIMGIVAVLMIFSDKRQTLWDRWAKTVVVRDPSGATLGVAAGMVPGFGAPVTGVPMAAAGASYVAAGAPPPPTAPPSAAATPPVAAAPPVVTPPVVSPPVVAAPPMDTPPVVASPIAAAPVDVPPMATAPPLADPAPPFVAPIPAARGGAPDIFDLHTAETVAPDVIARALDDAPTVDVPLRALSVLSLRLDDGRTVPVDRVVLLGRNPSGEPGDGDARLVPLVDAEMGISKTHVAFGVTAGAYWVEDRHSTNGTAFSPVAGGLFERLEPGRRITVLPGATVVVGSCRIEVVAVPLA